MEKQTLDALAAAQRWHKSVGKVLFRPTGHYYGYKYRNGQRTKQPAIVVAVPKKRPLSGLTQRERVPDAFDGVVTDVVEAEYSIPPLVPKNLVANPTAFTQRKRPAPGGVSVGHPDITAGTLGAWVHRGPGDEWYILSNNHVLANSNDARIGDRIIQPGRADGGSDSAFYHIAQLTEFATINFGGAGGGKKSKALFRWYWRGMAALANGLAYAGSLGTCPVRLVPKNQAVPQGENLVDSAIALALRVEDVDTAIINQGHLSGIRDLALGDEVTKTGRTTETTMGDVEGVMATVTVSYGDSGTATFRDQVIIRGEGGSEFSAGGDSGSAITVVHNGERFLAGLLFAGGGGTTIANKISHVVATLGVRV